MADPPDLDAQSNSSATPRVRAVPLGLLGMIVLVMAIEYFVARHWLDFSDPVSLSWRYSAQAATAVAPTGELLCVGDSLIKHGLIPAVIEQATGRRTVNLAGARCPTLMTYFLLRRALDAGATPRAIIVNAKPAVLLANPEFNTRYWQEILSPCECVEMLLVSRRGSFVLALVAGRVVPSLRCRLELRSSLLAAVRGRDDPMHTINRVLWRNWTKNSGANLSTADSTATGPTALEVALQNRADVLHVDPANALAVERLLQLTAQRNIPVFWLLAPLSPDLQAIRDRTGAEAYHEHFIHSVQARFRSGMTVLDARRAGYPPDLFADPTHLNRRGAVALSQVVSQEIKRALERPSPPARQHASWITLNSPVDSLYPASIDVEDLDRSRQIVELDQARGSRH
jgi:hypothetical protein